MAQDSGGTDGCERIGAGRLLDEVLDLCVCCPHFTQWRTFRMTDQRGWLGTAFLPRIQ